MFSGLPIDKQKNQCICILFDVICFRMENEPLTMEIVKRRLEYGEYFASKVDSRRHTSKAWKTIHKIFIQATNEAVHDPNSNLRWFYCIECKDVLARDISNGTSPLLTHQNMHERERKRKNERVAAALALANEQSSAPDINLPAETPATAPNNSSPAMATGSGSPALATGSSSPALATGSGSSAEPPAAAGGQSQSSIKYTINAEELAKSLGVVAGLCIKYGSLSQMDFLQMLPSTEQWYVFFHASIHFPIY